MGSGLSRLGEHNGPVVDAVGMVDDLDAADMNGSGRYRAVETVDERRIEVDTASHAVGNTSGTTQERIAPRKRIELLVR
mgnify:CR=1 FL=1